MDPYLGEIRIFAGTFAPRGWLMCDGQLLPISRNTALFSILGTYYGGDGRVTFALPDFRGIAPMHWGQGPGLTNRDLGEVGGELSVTLNATEVAPHTHPVNVTGFPADLRVPSNTTVLGNATGATAYQSTTSGNIVQLDPKGVSVFGTPGPHNNVQPYLTLTFIIAVEGIFPPRG